MDILVTGASGFMGRHLCRQLALRHRVCALSRSAQAPLANIHWLSTDLTAPDFEAALPSRVDAVVALAQSRHYRDFPEHALDVYEVNVHSLMRLLEWSRQRRITQFVYASSANVYAMGKAPIVEDDPLAPTTFYARTKLMGEMMLESFTEAFPSVALRLFTAYGPGQTGMLLPQLIDRIAGGLPVRIEGDEGLALSPVYVGDLCNVFEAALCPRKAWPRHLVLNVGGPDRVTIRSLAELIARTLDMPLRLDFVPGMAARGWVAEGSRLRTHLALPPFVSIVDGVRRTVHANLHRSAA